MRHAITLTAAVLLAAGCEGPGPLQEAEQAAMTALLNRAARAADARRVGEVTWYTPETLYDYIDGQAEEFLQAGFHRLAHSEYRAKGATGDAYVEVDLYRMASAEAAGAVMEPPPPDDALQLAPGVQAYRAETLCEFAAGPYYVRITPRLDAAGQAGLVDVLARALATGIKAD